MRTKIQLVCPQCEVQFEREKRRIKKGLTFCSRACNGRYHGKLRNKDLPHGYGRYRKGCRCDVCRAGNARRMRDYYAKPSKPIVHQVIVARTGYT